MSARVFTSRWWPGTSEKNELGAGYDCTRETRKCPPSNPFAPFAGSAASAKGPKKTVELFDADDGQLAAVKLRNTVIDDLWLVADDDALSDHPDIIRSGLPVFFFDELERLRGKTREQLRAIAAVKAAFPTSRVLQ
jgi:hypothetical protein